MYLTEEISVVQDWCLCCKLKGQKLKTEGKATHMKSDWRSEIEVGNF
jgi:hypothetical protein